MRECPCGSGLQRHELLDGYGIFLTFVCTRCRQEKLARFRPDIFEPYETDEVIEPEDRR
jgi:hypothetical protein